MVPQKKEEDMITGGYLKGLERSHNPKKEISKDSNGRLRREKLSEVSEDRLTKLTSEEDLFATHRGKRRAYEGKKTMATDGHSKGSKRSHKRSNGDEFDRELANIKVQLEVMIEFIQRSVEDQRYGWILQKKRVESNWFQITRLRHKECV